jgi:hypothetical protein
MILPDAKCLSEEELNFFEKFVQSGKALIITGETGKYDGSGQLLASNLLHQRLGIMDAAQPQHSNASKRFSFYPNCPGTAYYEELERAFNRHALTGEYREVAFYRQLTSFEDELKAKHGHQPAVEMKASPFISTYIAQVNGKPHVFIANFKGLKGKENSVQSPEKEVTVTFSGKSNVKIYALPLLGKIQEVPSERRGNKLTGVIPEISKGVVVWCE